MISTHNLRIPLAYNKNQYRCVLISKQYRRLKGKFNSNCMKISKSKINRQKWPNRPRIDLNLLIKQLFKHLITCWKQRSSRGKRSAKTNNRKLSELREKYKGCTEGYRLGTLSKRKRKLYRLIYNLQKQRLIK